VGAELVGQADSVSDQILAGPAHASKRSGGVAVGSQGDQTCPVGAQGVGEHECVEPVIFVAGRAVAAPQVFELVRADHHDGDLGVEQRVDDRPVRAFDRDLVDAMASQQTEQLLQSGGLVFHGGPVDLAATVVDNSYGMIVACPVDSGGPAVAGLGGQCVAGRLHVSLLAASPSGEAPLSGAGARQPVRSLIGARRRSALSTVRTLRGTAGPRRSHRGRHDRQASRAMIRQHPRCIGDPSEVTNTRMVHQ
jgi:hypothetical protein